MITPIKSIEGIFDPSQNAYLLTAELPPGKFHYRYAVGKTFNGLKLAENHELIWGSKRADARPLRMIDVPANQSHFVHDDGALELEVKNQFLEEGQSEVVVKFTNLETRLIADLPDVYKLKISTSTGRTDRFDAHGVFKQKLKPT